jgi:hypothetical protein
LQKKKWEEGKKELVENKGKEEEERTF